MTNVLDFPQATDHPAHVMAGVLQGHEQESMDSHFMVLRYAGFVSKQIDAHYADALGLMRVARKAANTSQVAS